MSKVSIIITTYNQASFVLQAVRSLLAQTWRDFEIFVVDDGSTDHTADLFATKLDSLSYIQQPHQGLRAGWLRGLSASTGDFLVFMHADELLPPRRLELQVQQLEAEPELGLVYFGRQPLVEGATHILRAAGDQGDNLLDDPLVALEFFLSGCPLIRRECVEKAGLLETPISLKDEWNPW